MKKVTSTLDKTLDLLGVTPYYLIKKTNIRSDTVYYIINNKFQRLNTKILEKILIALEEIAEEQGINRKFNIEDIIKYK